MCYCCLLDLTARLIPVIELDLLFAVLVLLGVILMKLSEKYCRLLCGIALPRICAPFLVSEIAVLLLG